MKKKNETMKLGFIGAGNMGGAIIRGYLSSEKTKPEDVIIFDADKKKSDDMKMELGIETAKNIEEVADDADVVFLAVKPNVYEVVLEDLKKYAGGGCIVVSMAAGVSIGYIESFLGGKAKIVRIMPNTPAMVGESMTGACRNDNVKDDQFQKIMSILRSFGHAEEVLEDLIDTVVGVSGSSPAYAYMFIEALIKGAEKNGMDPKKAKVFAAQSMLGAAKMVLETGIDPVTLRENVCSPGGATIEAVKAFEKNGLMDDVIEGMQAAIDKSKKMAK